MSSSDFFVVGIGASAGGLEALEQFFKACPETTGAAFVVVQHLSPDHKSIMHDLLARYTRMPIQVVEDGVALQPDHVYLIPPAALMRLTDKHLVLSRKDPHHLTLPIDIFFRSLAENRQEKAVGIILSGTGSDGSRGVVSINAEGGLVLVQDPQTAKFDGMPQSAIATGVMDGVLPPEKLSQRLVEHFLTPPVTPSLPTPQSVARHQEDEEVVLDKLLQLLADVGQIDFREYKLATVMRRIQRRMQVKQLASLQSYYKLLQESTEEVTDLRRELLIPVTSFFRDAQAYQQLAELVIPQLVEEAASGETLRVWVAGTSTGEEAYSLAILFHEAFAQAGRWPNLKIFATDVNPLVIEFASQGQYPEACAAELSVARLERFFNQVGSHYVAKPELRQSIVFARHNLLTDPPFTRMHLVSCRNVLIYFKPEAQERALHRLQYATRPGGALFLGSSESSNVVDRGFVTLDAKHKILQRNNQPLSHAPEVTRPQGALPGMYSQRYSSPKPYAPQQVHQDQTVIDEASLQLQNSYAPPAMLINDNQEVIHLFGEVQPYVALRSGSVSMLVGRILPESLIPVVSALTYKAFKENQALTSNRLEVTTSLGDQRQLSLRVEPVMTKAGHKYLLLCFEEQNQVEGLEGQPEELNIDSENTQRIATLQQELDATRQSLQATIEELETSNEELQATNEELMASNEELQSSNEELQSVNEELNTVNAEYQEKVGQLNRLNADLESMAKSVGIATVFLDGHLQLTRFSPDAVRLFNLRESDLGRPLEHLTHQLDYFELLDDLAFTLKAEEVVEKEVKSREGRVYLVRLLPYRIHSSKDQGVVASFVDITAFHDYKRLQAILDALPQKVAVLEKSGKIALINTAWQAFSENQEDPQLLLTALGANHLQANNNYLQGQSPEAAAAIQGLQEVLDGQRDSFVMKYPCHTATQKRWYVMNAAPIYGQHELSAVVSLINISNWNQLEANNGFIEN